MVAVARQTVFSHHSPTLQSLSVEHVVAQVLLVQARPAGQSESAWHSLVSLQAPWSHLDPREQSPSVVHPELVRAAHTPLVQAVFGVTQSALFLHSIGGGTGRAAQPTAQLPTSKSNPNPTNILIRLSSFIRLETAFASLIPFPGIQHKSILVGTLILLQV